jgi:hypothetical protein
MTSELTASKAPATIASSSDADWILGSTAVVMAAADGSTTGLSLSTGIAKGSAVWVNRHAIGCGGTQVVDSIALTFRCRAVLLNASTNNTAAVMKISLVNADNKPPVAVVSPSLQLGNFSTPGAFSQPVLVNTSGLKAICSAGVGANPRGRFFVQIQVTNNDRPIVVPFDDKAGEYNMQVGWAAAA